MATSWFALASATRAQPVPAAAAATIKLTPTSVDGDFINPAARELAVAR